MNQLVKARSDDDDLGSEDKIRRWLHRRPSLNCDSWQSTFIIDTIGLNGSLDP